MRPTKRKKQRSRMQSNESLPRSRHSVGKAEITGLIHCKAKDKESSKRQTKRKQQRRSRHKRVRRSKRRSLGEYVVDEDELGDEV
jgi:hypothetical protein